MQGMWVRSLVREDPTCHGAIKFVCHKYWACALEPSSHNYWAHMPQLLEPAQPRAHTPQLLCPRTITTEACTLWGPCAATTEARVPRARAPQQKKPPQWEAHTLQQRVAPARHKKKLMCNNEEARQPKENKKQKTAALRSTQKEKSMENPTKTTLENRGESINKSINQKKRREDPNY